jgi:hypothetical protein
LFQLTPHHTEGLNGSVINLLGLALAVPDHSTLTRRAETLEVPRSRVDSTGLKLCGAGEWLIEKHGTKTHRSWWKLHIGMDADTDEIVAATLTTNDVDDASQVGGDDKPVAALVLATAGNPALPRWRAAHALAARHGQSVITARSRQFRARPRR